MADYQISATLKLRDQMTAQLKAAASAAEKLTRGVGSASKGIGDIKLNVQGIEKLQRLQSMLRQGGMTVPPVNIRVNDSGATSKITKLRSDVSSLANRAWNVAVNIKTNGMAALNRARSSLTEMANGMAMGMGAGMMGVAGIGFGAVDAVQTYRDFEYQMKRNKALFTTGLDAEVAEQQYQDLITSARYYGSTMKFTASEVGKAQEYMALAGWDAPTSIKALPAILNAAVASGEDLALVSDIITDDMTALGYKAGTTIKNALGEDVEAAQHFADVMLRTTLRSNTNFQQLGYAMKYAAPLAHTLGYNIEEVAVAIGLMASNGIKADQAGTGLRGILNRFINEPKKAAEAMNDLGVSLFDSQLNARGLMTTLMDVRAALKGKNVDAMIDFAEQMTGEKVENRRELTDFLIEAKARGGGTLSAKDQAKLGSMLSGTYAMAAFMAIMNSSDEDIQKLMDEIYNKSDGTGADIAAQMADTLQGDLDTIKSAWEDFNVELLSGKGASGLRGFIQTLTADINQFKNALKDGLDFGDIGKLGLTILDQLKDKFLQLDGIGSILAGGALFAAMKKILSMGLQVKDTLSAWSKVKSVNDVGNILRGNQGALGTSQVGTMHVNAGVVNLNGPVKGGAPTTSSRGGAVPPTTTTRGGVVPPTTTTRGGVVTPTATSSARAGTTLATAGSILVSSRGGRNISTYDSAIRQQEVAARNTAAVNDYYARRQNIMSTLPPTSAPTSTLRANMGGMMGAGALAAVFGALDIYSAKSHSEQAMAEARETVQYQRNVLTQLKEQGESQDVIAAQARNVQDAEAFVERTRIMNQDTEQQAELGAAGAVTGAMAGAAIGSLVPVIGTAVGGMIGGILGQLAGTKLAEYGANQREQQRQARQENISIPAGSISDFRRADETSLADFKQSGGVGQYQAEISARQSEEVLRQNATAISQRQTLDRLESQGIDANETASAETLQRHRTDNWGYTAQTKYQQEMARGEYLAKQREEYNQRWQQQFGGTSLAGQANFVPDNERDRQILQQYDEVQANKQRQQNLTADIQNYRNNQSLANESVLNQKAELDKMAQTTNQWNQQQNKPVPLNTFDSKALSEQTVANQQNQLNQLAEVTNQWNQQQQATLNEIQNQKKLAESAQNVSQESGGFLDFLDNLLFNKAAANSITPETNMELSTPENSPVKPTAPSEGLFDFEVPDISEMFSNFEMPDIGARIGEIFSGIELPELGIAEKLSAEFDSAIVGLESFGDTISASFSGLAEGVSGALSGVGTAITTVFSSAATEVQGIWSAIPGFFSGVFAGIGGIASGAGSAIYSGLTSVIGGIIGAWQAAASTISGIISSIASAASAAASAIPSFGIGGNATGTSYWQGGWTEINEHGGEIINLPKGTQIIPHATTVNILRHEINKRIDNGENNFHGLSFTDYATFNKNTSIFGGDLINRQDSAISGDIITTLPPNKNQIGQRPNSVSNSPIENIFTSIFGWTPRQASFSGLPDLSSIFSNDGGALSGDLDLSLPNFDIEMPKIEMPKSSSSSSTSNSSNTINFGDVNISNGLDFDEFVHRLQNLISQSAANSEFI